MKRTFTLLFFSTFLICSMSAQESIWGGPDDPNGSFDGGLNDWTAVGVVSAIPDSVDNVLWVWDAEGVASKGSFWGTSGPIESTSVSNGAAVFDSDYLDSDGDASFGMGSGPCGDFDGNTVGSGHRGELISPTIDASMAASLVLKFNNLYRTFDATSSVGISNDDGATWTEIVVNQDISTNARTDRDNVQLINISQFAAGSSTVKIKFIFEGCFYYWIVDDVELLTLPAYDVSIVTEDVFYTPHSAVQPPCVLEKDTFEFTAPVTNLGADSADVKYLVRVFSDDPANPFHIDSLIREKLAPGETDTLTISELWAPEGLPVGSVLRISHEMSIVGNEDFNFANNTHIQAFASLEGEWRKEVFGPENVGFAPDGQWDVIAIYNTDANCQESFNVRNVEIALFSLDDEPFAGRPLEVYIVEPQFTGEGVDTLLDVDYKNFDNEQLKIIGFREYATTAEDEDLTLIEIDQINDPLNPEQNMPPLENGKTYWVTVAHNTVANSPELFHQYTVDPINSGLSHRVWIASDELYFTGFSNGGFPILRLITQMNPVSVNKEPLAEEAVAMYPNPTTSELNFDITLEESSYITITIGDLSGKVLSTRTFDKSDSLKYTYYTSKLSSGMYLAKVSTETGYSTKKFVVNK